jgi:tyrosinase
MKTFSLEQHSRRDFFKTVVAGGISLGTLSTLSGCNVIRETASGGRPIRRSFASLEQSDPNQIIDTYRDAVSQMRNLPSSDPRNWNQQAFIHGQGGSFTDCEHGNWLFLPWHRAYLFYFEDICRALTGNEDFALPYWNWAANPQIPQAFEQTSGTNPLFDPSRANTSVASVTSTRQPAIESMLSDPNFFRFAGGWNHQLNPQSTPKGSGSGAAENPPHNLVHATIGGNFTTAASPRDPIFWAHHCMVDCLWWEWNANREHPNTNDPDWWQSSFAGDFVDRDGDPVDDINVLITLLMPFLSYNYEESQKGNTQQFVEISPELRRFLNEGAEVELDVIDYLEIRRRIEVVLDQPVNLTADVELEALLPFINGEQPGRVLLTARQIDPPQNDNSVTRIFVNRPDASADLSTEDAHFAGSFGFFLAEESHMDIDYFIDVTDTLRRLRRQGALRDDESLSIQLISVPIEGRERQRGSNYAIGELAFAITRSIINGEVAEKMTE